MLHNEARKLLLSAWEKTHNAKEIAECFSVNSSTVYRLVKQEKTTGDYRTQTSRRGRKPLLSTEQKQQITELVNQQPDITLSEIIEELHLPASKETVRRVLCKMGYTFKKKSMHATEKERPRCAGQKRGMERRYCRDQDR